MDLTDVYIENETIGDKVVNHTSIAYISNSLYDFVRVNIGGYADSYLVYIRLIWWGPRVDNMIADFLCVSVILLVNSMLLWLYSIAAKLYYYCLFIILCTAFAGSISFFLI